MRPGTLSICSTCRHRSRSMANAGHPSPCHRQFWDGPKLHVPKISAAGCNEFEAPEPAPPTGPSEGDGPETASVPPGSNTLSPGERTNEHAA